MANALLTALLISAPPPMAADGPPPWLSADIGALAQADVAATAPGTPLSAAPSADPSQQPPAIKQPDHDITVSARKELAVPGDPMAEFNLKSFQFTQSVDRALVAPIAKAYQRGLPKPVRGGLRHVLRNLDEPIVFVNFLLQLKPGRATKTLARLAINSSFGIGGLLDVAGKPSVGLPYQHNGFANTLGYYGVKPGAYLYLPLIGPTTVRDLVGLAADRFTLPLSIGKPFNRLYFAIPATTLRALDYRVEFDEKLQALHSGPSPYAKTRDAYLAAREREIQTLHAHIPLVEPLPQ